LELSNVDVSQLVNGMTLVKRWCSDAVDQRDRLESPSYVSSLSPGSRHQHQHQHIILANNGESYQSPWTLQSPSPDGATSSASSGLSSPGQLVVFFTLTFSCVRLCTPWR